MYAYFSVRTNKRFFIIIINKNTKNSLKFQKLDTVNLKSNSENHGRFIFDFHKVYNVHCTLTV